MVTNESKDFVTKLKIERSVIMTIEKMRSDMVAAMKAKDKIRKDAISALISAAKKVAIDEETVRLRSHLQQCANLLEAKEPVGRKLDFLVQEMNREVNTIGSKAQNLSITQLVVEMKSEIEKIREQIQNIE